MTTSMLQPHLDLAPPSALIDESHTLLDALGGWALLASLAPHELRAALRTATPAAQSLLLAMRQVLQPPAAPRSVHDAAPLAGWLMADMSHLEQEELRVVLLDAQNIIIDVVTVYIGKLTGIEVRLADVFKPAVTHAAASVILVHNHPSNALANVSHDDLAITRAAVAAGRLLEIAMLDHLIIAKGSYVSLRERHTAVFA